MRDPRNIFIQVLRTAKKAAAEEGSVDTVYGLYVWVQSYGWIHVSTARMIKSCDLPSTDDSDLGNLS